MTTLLAERRSAREMLCASQEARRRLMGGYGPSSPATLNARTPSRVPEKKPQPVFLSSVTATISFPFNLRSQGYTIVVSRRLESLWKPAPIKARDLATRARDLVAQVCHKYSVSEEGLLSPRRIRQLSVPRHELMYLLHQHTDWSFRRIGKFLNRDHDSVRYGIAAHAQRTGVPCRPILAKRVDTRGSASE